jgi:hypothetical protein
MKIAKQNADNLSKKINFLSNLIEKVRYYKRFTSKIEKFINNYLKKVQRKNKFPIDTINASLKIPWYKVSSKFVLITTSAFGLTVVAFFLIKNNKKTFTFTKE